MNVTFSNEFEYKLDSLPLKFCHGIIFIVGEFIALVSYYGFVHFEKYGGDPMKRSLKNKLVAQICYQVVVQTINQQGTGRNTVIKKYFPAYLCMK